MKINYKKIATVLGSALMVGSTMGLAAAATFPAPFVENGAANVAVVTGANAILDSASATKIASSLSSKVSGGATTTTTTTLGSEKHLIVTSGDDLNFAQDISNVEEYLNNEDLPTLLSDGTLEDEGDTNTGDDQGGDEFDYTQKLYLGDNAVAFDTLGDSENYVKNADLASNELPLLYLDQTTNEAWSLLVDFDGTIDAEQLDDSETIMIAGTKLTFDPDMAEDTLTMFASSQVISVNVDASKTIEVGGKSFSIKVIGANTENDEATLDINGDMKQVEKGDTITVEGQKFYINEVFMQTVPTPTAAVEIFAGAKEITIEADDAEHTIQVDGDDLKGMKATVFTDSDVNEITEIEFKFTPKDLDVETDEVQFLEIGETITDPLFGTIAMTFDAAKPALTSTDRELTQFSLSGDELKIAFTNKDGKEISINPYTGDNNAENVTVQEDWFNAAANDFAANLNNVAEDNIFILEDGADITDVYRVESIDGNTGADTDRVQFYSYAKDKTFWVEAGDQLENTGAYVCAEDGTAVMVDAEDAIDLETTTGCTAGLKSSLDYVVTENGLTITLGNPTVNGDDLLEANINIDEADMENDESTTVTADLDLTISSTGDNDLEMSALTDTGASQASDADGDWEYTVTNGYATYFVREATDGKSLKVYAPAEETDFDVYVSSVAGTTTSTVVYAGGVMSVKDTEVSTVQDKNLIVVGGSCINAVAERLVGSKACGAAFTTATGVGAGQFIVQSYASPYNTAKIALLVAGYEAADTDKAATYLVNNAVNTAVGTKEVKTSTSVANVA